MMPATSTEGKKVRIDTSAAVPVHLEGPGRGPVIGRIAKDAGPKSTDYPSGPYKDFPWHAILDIGGGGIVGSCESYGAALARLFGAWAKVRVGEELR